MLSVFLQSWWLWVLFFSFLFYLLTYQETVIAFFAGVWERGPYSMLVFLGLFFCCALNYLSFNVTNLYIYTHSNEELQVVAPTPAPTPIPLPTPTLEPGERRGAWDRLKMEPIFRTEEMMASAVNLPFMLLVEMYRPFIPWVLVGLFGLSIFGIIMRYVRLKIIFEQINHPPHTKK